MGADYNVKTKLYLNMYTSQASYYTCTTHTYNYSNSTRLVQKGFFLLCNNILTHTKTKWNPYYNLNIKQWKECAAWQTKF